MGELVRSVNNSILLRYLMLLEDGARLGIKPSLFAARAPERTDTSVPTVHERRSPSAQQLARRIDVRARCERAFALLLENMRALAGVLFADGPDGVEVLARSGEETVSRELLDAVQAFADRAAQGTQPKAHRSPWTSARGMRYVLLELQVAGADGPALVGPTALRLAHDAEELAPSAVLLSAVGRALQEAAELSAGRPFDTWMEF